VTGCGPILAQLYHSQYVASKTTNNTKPVILPIDMANQTAPGAFPGTVYNDGLALQATPAQISNTGTGGGAAADVFGALDFYRSYPFTVPRYAAGNQTMQSCAEYAWKKWGTYSWWNDVARASGIHYASAMLGATDPSLPYDILLNPSRWDGQPMSVNADARKPMGFATNPFFGYDPGKSDDPTLEAIHEAIVAADPDASVGEWPPFHTGVTLLTKYDDFAFSPRVYAEHLAAGVTDAHYSTGAVRSAAYGRVVGHYLDVVGALNADMQELHAIMVGGPTGETAGGSRLAQNSAAATAQAKALRAEIASLKTDMAATAADIQARLLAEWNFDPDHGCLGRTFHGQALEANYCDWSPQIAVDEYSEATEYRWAAYRRCIEDTGDDFSVMTSTAAQARIWTDPHFYRTYNDTLAHLENLDGTDALQRPIKVDFLDAYEHRADINDAEHTYQLQEIAQYEKATQDLPLQGPAGKPSAIGQSMHDGNDVGGDWFGAGYNYTAGWSLTPHNQLEFGQTPLPGDVPRICRIDGEVYGSLEAHAVLLKTKTSLVDVGLHATTGPGHVTLQDAHVDLLGQEVFQDKEDWTGTAMTFDVPIDSTPAEPSFSTVIPLLGVPINVGAGAAVHLGADPTLNASPPPVCDVNNLSLSLSGGVKPNVRVDAKAWAALDLLVVSVGVEGTLNLVTIDLPITTNVSLAGNPTSGLSVDIESEATLNMSELSGHVDLYAEADLGFWSDRADLTLFSWDGLHQQIPLYSRHKSYPIDALNYVFFQQVKP
jgi:hypothetical protein